MSFSVLFVCTGNICRSPLAERLLRSRLDESLPITVASAGTMGLVGYGIDAPSALALRELGVDPDGHEARRVDGALVGAADLVLTAESAHRSTVVQSDPLSFRRVFTMREFARLGAALPKLDEPVTEDDLRGRVLLVADQRGQLDPPAPGEDEIGDPFGGSPAVARATAAEISATVDGIRRALGLLDPAIAS